MMSSVNCSLNTFKQAAVNARLAEERREIVEHLETLQRNYQGQDPAILGIVVLLVKARGVA